MQPSQLVWHGEQDWAEARHLLSDYRNCGWQLGHGRPDYCRARLWRRCPRRCREPKGERLAAGYAGRAIIVNAKALGWET